MQRVDLSHVVEDGMITYQGLPAPSICDYLSREDSRQFYAEDTSFHIGKIELVSNTGTYLDAPFHRYADGIDLADLPLESLAHLPAITIQTAAQHIDAATFEGLDLAGKAVLIYTNWSRYWRTEQYFSGHPFLTEAAAITLRDAGVRLVGIDSYNIDDTNDRRRPVHTVLLGAEIPIIEHMCNLDQVPNAGYFLHAAPVKIRNFGTFPVRAYALIP